ncbi:MAG: hypothetical protein H6Q14_1812 [Bacteroidetes bacterium]|nr:hypothetical protein [Bacteroidota bacterium]
MIETNVKIHDKFSFEFKISFISDQTTADSHEEFSINTWLFVPNSLEINSDTYSKQDFFKDVNSKIRFITPDFLLPEIISSQPGSPRSKLLHSLQLVLKEPASDEKGEQFVHEVKVFANICKSSIRDEVTRIVSLPNAQGANRCRQFVADLQRIVQFYRNLYSQVHRKDLSDEWKEYFAYGDNFISNVIEQHAFRLMRHFENEDNYAEIKDMLLPLILSEEQERRKKKFPNLEANNPENNNWVVMQWGILKKVIESVLFLHIKSSRDGRFAEQFFYSIAAGVSMLFATVVTFKAQQHYQQYTLPLFLIIVVSYMFKDRIKDLMRYYFSSQLGKKYFDRKRKLSTRAIEIGVIKESAEYVSEAKLPEEVFNLRQRIPIVEAENRIYNEQIILYKKLVTLSVTKISSLKEYNYRGINDILKFHLFHLTEKMSDSSLPLFVADEQNGYLSFRGQKVYPLHFILRGESNKKVFYRKYRVLFNRDGIKKMEEVVAN